MLEVDGGLTFSGRERAGLEGKVEGRGEAREPLVAQGGGIERRAGEFSEPRKFGGSGRGGQQDAAVLEHGAVSTALGAAGDFGARDDKIAFAAPVEAEKLFGWR